MPSPRIAVALAAFSALALAASPASAVSDDDARAAAIAACRTAVAQQLSVDAADLTVERVNTRGRTIELRLEARKDGARVGAADCTFARRAGTTTVAVIGQTTASAAPK